ncbi:MAG: DUF1385 domain-containing protein [Bryobacterales bacterium]
MKNRLRQFFRLATHLQLMPVLESGDDPLIGGQAVIEGVMMRTPHSYCISVRRPNGEIIQQEGVSHRLSEVSKFWKLPVIRGLGTLGQAMSLGIKALKFSADNAIDEGTEAVSKENQKPAEVPGWMMALNVAFSLGFFLFLYKFVPLVLTSQLKARVTWLDGQFAFSLVDGVIRLAIFLTVLGVISRLSDIRRVFEYHGAEHKVVFNYESGQPVTIAEAQKFVTFHPRCGTSFLMVVMLMSILVYALVPYEGFAMQFAARIVLLPVIAGVSYEVIRFASRRRSRLFNGMVAPGLWLQRITTKNPADDQVEVSIHALTRAMALEEKQDGELVIA